MAVTVGNGRSSMALKALLDFRHQPAISSSGSLNISVNSVMSAPTMKTDLLLVTIMPLIELLPFNASAAAPSSSTVWRLNLFTDSPCRSKFSSTMPSSNGLTVMAFPSYIINVSPALDWARLPDITERHNLNDCDYQIVSNDSLKVLAYCLFPLSLASFLAWAAGNLYGKDIKSSSATL